MFVAATLLGPGCGPTPLGQDSRPTDQLVWLDSSGRTLGVVPRSAATYSGLWLARDERSAVARVLTNDESYRLWRIDLTTGDSRPLAESSRGATESPGRLLTHWSEERLVFDLFDTADADGSRQIAAGQDATSATPFLATPWIERDGQLSAEGQWMAYVSEESGRPEVYVQTYPDPTVGRWLVSLAEGGRRPAWRADSLMLYYWAPGGGLMGVPLKRGRRLVQPGRPEQVLTAGAEAPYAVSRDGSRILIAVPLSNVRP